MKILLFIIAFYSTYVYSSVEVPKWFPHKNYVASTEIVKAFEVAQQYYVNNTTDISKPIDYEYHAYTVKGGYVVSIMVLYRDGNGGHNVVLDGEQCIYLNTSYTIKGTKQCMSANPNPLAE
ncbi:MAG: hypothetical protein ACI9NY_000035 [Kiritimatiellia bacterium]|jgi:hypothetical protein